MLDSVLQDLRYAVRQLRARPGFTFAAVLVLALGIGANTAMFSVVNAVLLQPLPFRDPEALIVLYERNRSQGVERDLAAAETLDDWRRDTRTLSGLVAWRYWGLTLTGDGEPEDVSTIRASANVFDVLGVMPALGRSFLPEEGQPGRHHVVVLSHGFWTQRFGADPRTVGRTLTLDDRPHTVIGVMPPGFRFPDDADVEVWMPLVYEQFEQRTRNQRMFEVLGRLAPGATLETAQAELGTIAARLAATYPNTNSGWDVAILPAKEVATGAASEPLLVLLGAVTFVLLIACANVGNLFLARAADREREMAIRAALGASRARLVRQLLAESGLVALTGGVTGVLLAMWGIDLLLALAPAELPRWNPVRIDGRVLAFALGLAGFTAILTGLVPARELASPDLGATLKEGSGRATSHVARTRLRRGLVVVETGLAIALLAGAGLLIKSFARLQRVDPGFNPDRLLAATIYLPDHRYPDDARQAAFYVDLLERVRALPGVTSAGAVTTLPMSPEGVDHDLPVSIEGRELPTTRQPQADFRIASPGYFETMGIAVLRGRTLTEHDRADAPPVVVVNQVLVNQLLPGEDPIGKRIRYFRTGPFAEIVGVVGQVHHRSLDAAPRPEIYISYRQLQYGAMTVVVRAAGDPLALAEPIKAAVFATDPVQPITQIATMNDLLHRSVAGPRFNTLLLGTFAALALVLASIGIYGVVSYTVSRRTHEIGIRMALGARSGDVFRAVVGDGVRLAAIGTALGVLVALALGRALSSLLFQVSPHDPVVLAVVALLLIGLAALACSLPARRATQVDPMVALRTE
ncbi:MAG TPA: ABC transporter permease [Gemmatimonadales bacterium]